MRATLVEPELQTSERAAHAGETANGRSPAPTAASWVLKSSDGSDSSAKNAIAPHAPFKIGRATDCELSLANPTVSAHHAELFFVADDLFVRDLSSTNGTFVNGRRIRDIQRLRSGDFLQFGTERFTVQQLGGGPTGASTVSADAAGEAIGHIHFDRLLEEPAVIPYFQPIVRLGDLQPVGFEVLARSRLMGLDAPGKMFRIAVERGMAPELSRLMRREGIKAGRALGPQTFIYMNTHPAELKDRALFDSLEQLRQDAPDALMTLEIHESAATSTAFLAELRAHLRDLRIGLAYDDFGAGQARLLELVKVPPDVIKFDMCLVQGLSEASKEQRQTVHSLVEIVQNLGVIPLAECIETDADAAACRELGFELAQGYCFGRPAPLDTWLGSTSAGPGEQVAS